MLLKDSDEQMSQDVTHASTPSDKFLIISFSKPAIGAPLMQQHLVMKIERYL